MAANTPPGSPLVYNVPIAHVSRFHLTFSSPHATWTEWFADLKALIGKSCVTHLAPRVMRAPFPL